MEIETLATGFGLIEGPRVDEQGRLYFADHGSSNIYRRNSDGGLETLVAGRKSVGGLAFCESGKLLMSGPSLARWDEKTGKTEDLFSKYEGHTIKFLNDMTVDPQGSVYIGSMNYEALNRDATPVPGDLYRVDPDGTVTVVGEGYQVSNGLGFSPDGKLLYHADSPPKAINVYDVAPDRTLRNRRVFAKVPEGFPDGLAVDAEGGVWVAAIFAYELVRFKPDGTVDRRVKMPSRMVVSMAFGGPDMQDLYVVTGDNVDRPLKGTIFKMRSDIPGLPVPKAKF
ncbi:MAG TPA: SMP-30/gluconolactonase/LRE family protein [Candidatus Binataceae bacterium]|jgi:gluconolactonase|nr:SMP-30/gluconolactonase/LRE family protein [Candidatus Binataceae bacterium]